MGLIWKENGCRQKPVDAAAVTMSFSLLCKRWSFWQIHRKFVLFRALYTMQRRSHLNKQTPVRWFGTLCLSFAVWISKCDRTHIFGNVYKIASKLAQIQTHVCFPFRMHACVSSPPVLFLCLELHNVSVDEPMLPRNMQITCYLMNNIFNLNAWSARMLCVLSHTITKK